MIGVVDEVSHPESRSVALVTGATGAIGRAIAERLEGSRITVNTCHPGDVVSTLSRNLGFGGHETPDQAASTPVWVATEAIGAEETGKYFEHRREVSCRFGTDRDAVEALYRACEGYR